MLIAPFTCSECGVEFGHEHGAVSGKCNELFCDDHVYKVNTGAETVFLCKTCKGNVNGAKVRSNIPKIRRT